MRVLRSSAVFIVGASMIGDAIGFDYRNKNVGNGGMAHK
jgi:hypothetical protein